MAMEAKVYYQDIMLNAEVSFNLASKVEVRPDKAVLVATLQTTENYTPLGFCDWIYAQMNHLDIPVGHPDRPIYERAGHTSMSIGDYIEIGSVRFVCTPVGWETVTLLTNKEIVDSHPKEIPDTVAGLPLKKVKEKMATYFEMVADEEDWKGEILTAVQVKDFEFCRQAVRYYTATELKLWDIDEGRPADLNLDKLPSEAYVDVYAKGYRLGPAGDK